MARKTVEVEAVRETANNFLAARDSSNVEGIDPYSCRMGVAALVENVLHRTGNYRGFRFLPSETDDTGALRPDADQSRRQYL